MTIRRVEPHQLNVAEPAWSPENGELRDDLAELEGNDPAVIPYAGPGNVRQDVTGNFELAATS